MPLGWLVQIILKLMHYVENTLYFYSVEEGVDSGSRHLAGSGTVESVYSMALS